MPNIIKPAGINRLWAAGGTKTDPGASKTNIGWVVELPPYQYQNWVDNRQDTFIAHINQHGIPEWDTETEYQGNLSYTQGSDGFIYKCIQTNTNRNPTSNVNSAYWVRAFETYGSVQVVQDSLDAHIAQYKVLGGLSNTALARSNLSVYSKAESDTRFAAVNGNVANNFNVKDATLPNHAVSLGQVSGLLTGATTTAPGVIVLASSAEVEAGTNAVKAVTPAAGNAVYAKKSQNLADLPSKPAARTNLGLADTATMASSTFLKGANNLSDVASASVARTNLGLGSAATASAGDFLRTSLNLSDVPDKAAARTNLGLTSLATANPSLYMLKSDNLAGITNPAVARANLQLADSATIPSNNWLARGNNLADLTNVQAARNNLGLGAAATMPAYGNFGTLDFTSSLGQNGFQRFPGGFTIQWGIVNVPGDGHAVVTFPIPFTQAYVGQSCHIGTGYNMTTDALASFTFINNAQAYVTNGYGYSGVGMSWIAFGFT